MLFISNVIAFKYSLWRYKKKKKNERWKKKYVKYFISSKIVLGFYLFEWPWWVLRMRMCPLKKQRKKKHKSILQRITYQMHTYAWSLFRFYLVVVGAATAAVPSQMRLRRMKNVPFTRSTCLFVDYSHDNDMP